jgi:hypothetical protein
MRDEGGDVGIAVTGSPLFWFPGRDPAGGETFSGEASGMGVVAAAVTSGQARWWRVER